MTIPREALEFYADDELAVMREQCRNRLIDRRLSNSARADFRADVSLITRELDSRRRVVRRHQQLVKQLAFQE